MSVPGAVADVDVGSPEGETPQDRDADGHIAEAEPARETNGAVRAYAPSREDPAGSIVPIGELPAVRPPAAAPQPTTSDDAQPVAGAGAASTRADPPATDIARGWVVTAVLTAIAAVVRFWQLGLATDGGTPLFDEKYYAIQAAEVLRNGGVEDNQAYGVVVHPPFGKQLIAIGEAIFGYNAFGWRFASAVAGTVCVLVIIRVVRRMTRSTLLGGIAGVLLIADGVSHVQSRSALLDIFQAAFVLAAFACLVADRDQVRDRLAGNAGELPRAHWAGPALGARWWRFAAGVLLGLAAAVKWSGFYSIAAFGVLVVVWDISARRDAGIRHPVRAVLRRDLLPSLWSLAVVPVLVYVGSWWAWFSSETAWARHLLVAENRGDWKSGTLYELAALWNNTLWQWTWKMLDFHSHLLTPEAVDERHPWESKPWTWPLGTRPVLYYSPADGEGCGDGRVDCVRRIMLIGTPALWWIALFVAVWALWKAIGRLDWRYAAVLVGYGAGFLPWFTNLDRQMYFFYATPLAPFLVIGVTLVLGDILGRADVGVERRLTRVAIVGIYVGLVVANFVWLWPVLNGNPIPPELWRMQIWLPSWG